MLRRNFMKMFAFIPSVAGILVSEKAKAEKAACNWLPVAGGVPRRNSFLGGDITIHSTRQVGEDSIGLFCGGRLIYTAPSLYVNWKIERCPLCGMEVETHGVFPNQIINEAYPSKPLL